MEPSLIKTITCPVARAASETPDRVALMDASTSLTCKQLECAVEATITNLRGHGIRSGDVVAVLDNNSISYAILFYSAFRMGFVMMPLNTRLNQSDWQRQLDQANCQLIVYGEKFKSGISQLNVEPVLIEKIASINSSDFQIPDLSELELDRRALIIFSSGAAGDSRGVVLTWSNLYHSALGIESVLAYDPDNRWLAVLPFFHIGGISILFRTVLAGCGACVMNRFNPGEIIDVIDREQVHYLSVVPTMLRDLIRKDRHGSLSKLKAIVVGGAAFDKALQDIAISRDLPVMTTYGMTETSSMVTLLPKSDMIDKIETAGRALPFRELKITDDNDGDLPPEQMGRIMVRGEVVFSHYLNQEDQAVDPSGWFDTGDIGQLDGDGYLIVTGRADRVIISGGENINLAQIEDTLGAVEGIAGAVVMAQPSLKWGERPVAFVETSSGRVTENGIKEVLRDLLPAIMIPDRIIIVDNLPLTGSGKYDRKSLEEKYRSVFEADN
jgi:O-succinylbenzoic acid--CoA ligase